MANTVREVVEIMLVARTNTEIDAAWLTAKEWLREHPEDRDRVYSAGEQLRMMQLAVRVP